MRAGRWSLLLLAPHHEGVGRCGGRHPPRPCISHGVGHGRAHCVGGHHDPLHRCQDPIRGEYCVVVFYNLEFKVLLKNVFVIIQEFFIFCVAMIPFTVVKTRYETSIFESVECSFFFLKFFFSRVLSEVMCHDSLHSCQDSI